MANARRLAVDELLDALANNPRRIADATAGAPAGLLRTRPSPDEWSAVEVLAHLRSCDDIWGECIRAILAADRPTIRAVSPRGWSRLPEYEAQEFATSLRAWTTQRAALVAVLRGLGPDGWTRAATVTGAGRPLTRTVDDYAQWLASHERAHVKQIARAAADQGATAR